MPSRSGKQRGEEAGGHRKLMRDQGLRLIEIWVPDVHSPIFAAEAHRQSMAVARSEQAEEDQNLIDRVSDLDVT
jgi:hypothetical protein